VDLISQAQGWVLLLLGIAALALCVYALIDLLRQPAQRFVAADKRTKNFWLLVVGVSTLCVFVTFGNVLSFIPLLGVVGAGVYLADVKPALDATRGGRGSGGRTMGPYGPW
jgi:Kef-type K+ transport system membrane component KefB